LARILLVRIIFALPVKLFIYFRRWLKIMSYKGKFIAARTVEIEYLISEQNRKNSKVKLSIKALLNASAY